MKTRLTELLGIAHPVVQASMAWIAEANLAGAVSESGGLGVLGPNAGATSVTTEVEVVGRRLRDQIRAVRSITDRPFGVNFVVGTPGLDRAYSDISVEVALEEKVPVAVVSQGSPATYTERLKNGGMKVIHVCSTVRHAVKAESCGVDAVVVSGTEGGGHSGFHQISTFCLVPQVARSVKIPIIAGGGVGDGRGLMAALALGADGVYMGTRFMATRECPAHQKVKQVLLDAADTSTIAIRHGSPVPRAATDSPGGNRGFVEERRGSLRLILNEFISRALLEKGGELNFDDLFGLMKNPDPQSGSNRTVACFLEGNTKDNPVSAGQVAGLIDDVPTCAELLERMVEEAQSVGRRLSEIQSENRTGE